MFSIKNEIECLFIIDFEIKETYEKINKINYWATKATCNLYDHGRTILCMKKEIMIVKWD